MYRQQEDSCSECLQLLSDLLSRAQAYVAHLGASRPRNQFKKDDDLHESLWSYSASHSVRALADPSTSASIPVALDPPFSSLPSVYEAHSHVAGVVHVPLHQALRQQVGGARSIVPAAQNALTKECACSPVTDEC
jgi:hypothetical protein